MDYVLMYVYARVKRWKWEWDTSGQRRRRREEEKKKTACLVRRRRKKVFYSTRVMCFIFLFDSSSFSIVFRLLWIDRGWRRRSGTAHLAEMNTERKRRKRQLCTLQFVLFPFNTIESIGCSHTLVMSSSTCFIDLLRANSLTKRSISHLWIDHWQFTQKMFPLSHTDHLCLPIFTTIIVDSGQTWCNVFWRLHSQWILFSGFIHNPLFASDINADHHLSIDLVLSSTFSVVYQRLPISQTSSYQPSEVLTRNDVHWHSIWASKFSQNQLK